MTSFNLGTMWGTLHGQVTVPTNTNGVYEPQFDSPRLHF